MMSIFGFLALGLACICLEFFFSGSIFAALGVTSCFTSLIFLWRAETGWLFFSGYALTLFGCIACILYMLPFFLRRKKISLETDQEGFLACKFSEECVQKNGIVVSDLKPGGYIRIETTIHSAISLSGYLEKGALVRVLRGQGSHLVVEKIVL